MTFSDLQGHYFIASSTSNGIFHQLCSSWQDTDGHRSPRSLSATAELLAVSGLVEFLTN